MAAGPLEEALTFTADDGLTLARLAGEAQAKRRGGALRPGLRPVHTCGVTVTGTYRPLDAGERTPPALRTPARVTARFSSCDADARPDDRRWGPRGLAVRFEADGEAPWDLVAMSTDRFPVATLSAFQSVAAALSSPLPVRLPRLVLLSALRQFRSPIRFLCTFAPVSYAHLDYQPIHTFLWEVDGRPVRYRWKAVAGRRRTRPWMRLTRGADYLRRDLAARLTDGGGVSFELQVQRPAGLPAARLRDVGRPLPGSVPWAPVGTLHLDAGLTGEAQAAADRFLYSPAHLPPGVAPYPGDEIFAARTAAYPASHVYREGCTP